MQSEHFEKFTKNAKLSLTSAQKAARAMGEAYIGTEHILVGLVSNPEALAAEILEGHAVTLEKVQLALSFSSKSRFDGNGQGLTDPAKKVIEKAVATAARHQHYYVGTEHLLLGILTDKNTKAYSILEELGPDPERIKAQVMNLFRHTGGENSASPSAATGGSIGRDAVSPGGGMLKKQPPSGQSGQSGHSSKKRQTTPALDYFSTDLTELAANHKLDPVVGRADEVQRVIQTLGRRTKNNPVLIGEPGIGKTAIVEGLAARIIAETVPEVLHGKRILALDLPLMVAGTKYRGEFEERVKQVIDELKKQADIIIFIDELHTIVGAGAAEGSMDAAQILKPALARGEVQTIGATTLDEYRKHIEKDAALERRFQPIHVKEPTPEETVAVLRGLRKAYEEHHGVEITDEAIETAVRLSTRYIADRFLPDKAIDLIDEASSAGRLRQGGMTPELKKLKDELSEVNRQKDKAVEAQDYEAAAALRDKSGKVNAKIKAADGGVKVQVTDEDIAVVVAQWTGIPVMRLVEAEAANLVGLEAKLKTHIIGQDEAVSAVSRSIRRSRVGIGSPKRPMGSFIFLGPTGVGKTELVKVLAREVFGSEDNLVKIDMSEFMERHNVSQLVGAPAGYVGYEDGGKLTEKIRRNPYSVVLFDEIEKAHPEVFNVLLQILEDGYLSDAKGRKVDFRNTIIILTSNVGAAELQKTANLGFRVQDESSTTLEAQYDRMKQRVLEQLRDRFKPEFLNRLDQIVVFRPLVRDIVGRIVDLQLAELASRLRERDLKLAVDTKAKEALVTKGFDPKYGARPVRRAIQTEVEDALAERLLNGKIKDGDRIRIGYAKETFNFTPTRTKKRIPTKK